MFHYGSEATCQTKGKCSVCGYEYYGEHDVAAPNYVYIDDMKCGSYCATEGCDHLSEWSYHTGGTSDCQHKAICEICHHEYGKLGDHTPKAEWTTDATSHWHACKVCEGEKLDLAAHLDENSDGSCDVCGYTASNQSGSAPSGEPDAGIAPTDDGEDGIGTGAIIAIIIGSVAVVGIGGFAFFWFVIKKKTFADLKKSFKK